jgi:hypothetical protein
MLTYKYRTCQDKLLGIWEVIGGAGVRGGGEEFLVLSSQLLVEMRKARIEIREKRACNEVRVKFTRTKRLAKGSPPTRPEREGGSATLSARRGVRDAERTHKRQGQPLEPSSGTRVGHHLE